MQTDLAHVIIKITWQNSYISKYCTTLIYKIKLLNVNGDSVS